MNTKLVGHVLWGFFMTFVALVTIAVFATVVSFFIWDVDSDQQSQRQLHNSIVTNSTALILITLSWFLSAFWGNSRAIRKATKERKKITILLASLLVVVFITWQLIVVEVTNGKLMFSIYSVPIVIVLGALLSLFINQRKNMPNQALQTTSASARRLS